MQQKQPACPETERLTMRQYTYEDAQQLCTIIGDAETMRYYEKPYDEAGVRRWIEWNLDNYESLGFGLWALERKEDGRLIGDCGITMQIIDHRIVPEIGYHVHKAFWKQGYASEAARACRDWIFLHTPFQTVYSYMNAENTASCRVAEKNGMTYRKTYADGEIRLKVYSITRSEWEHLQNK